MPRASRSLTSARGRRQAPAVPSVAALTGAGTRVTTGGIRWDTVDIRDRFYEPMLAPLAPMHLPEPRVVKALSARGGRWSGLPRTQGPGDEGTCAGQALAALIDIQRLPAADTDREPVSARMLYWTARVIAAGAGQPGEVSGVSLREVIKAFYNYGVCSDADWPDRPGDRQETLTVERGKAARKVVLGAYYRLRPNLNAYHAALTETGALIVAAELHDGWLPERVNANRGVIEPPPPSAMGGTLGFEKHAFVIVGYTAAGFLVLNSWGPDWGLWQPPERDPAPYPGVALWRYADWANAIVDGWVLRLGVGGDGTFEFSIGEQGLGFLAEGPVRSTPVYSILGHFMHLDDGRYVEHGDYASSRDSLMETAGYLGDPPRNAAGIEQGDYASSGDSLLKTAADLDDPPRNAVSRYNGVLLTFAGGLLGVRAAAEQIARWKPLVRESNWYPFTVLFCVDGVEDILALLDQVFSEAQARLGQPGPAFDRFVEARVHLVGRALWRDLLRGAGEAARPRGPLHDLVQATGRVTRSRPGFKLRIIAESEGVFALARLVAALRTKPFQAHAAAWFNALESVDLIAPPLEWSEYQALAEDLNAGWGRTPEPRQIYVHVPTSDIARRLRVPPYGGSWFELIQRGFLRRPPSVAEAAAAPGEDPAPTGIAPAWQHWQQAPRTWLVPIQWPAGAGLERSTQPITQRALVYDSDIKGRLLRILQRGSSSTAPTGA